MSCRRILGRRVFRSILLELEMFRESNIALIGSGQTSASVPIALRNLVNMCSLSCKLLFPTCTPFAPKSCFLMLSSPTGEGTSVRRQQKEGRGFPVADPQAQQQKENNKK